MQAAGYIRVSSKAQTFELQRHALQRAAAARGDALELREEKRTGSELARPELDRLRAEIRAGLVKRLYVFRLDRLTRTGVADTFKLLEELRRHGCELVTVSDGFDLSGPWAEPLIAMMAWAAKLENHVRRERQSAARERMEASGKRWGRPQRLSAEQLGQARRMKDEGRSLRTIAMALKVPRATLGRALAPSGG